MKYGDTLRQRSIPEWGHFNIDYDYLKDLIKDQTTPGAGKAVPIPGQVGTTERAFGETFFQVLKAQHDRINLFVRSESGEIERRLEFISRRLLQLEARLSPEASGARLPARTIEKYAKIDADVSKAGDEIRSLSRFQVAQRTGFYKILKKYKRWTKDSELQHRFKDEVTGTPDSFFQLDLESLLDQYIDVLQAVRAPFNNRRATSPSIETHSSSSIAVNGDTSQSSPASRLHLAVEEGSEVDIDIALSAIPLGSRGSKATYWIHSDHVVEAEVLLLHYTRLYTGSTAGPSLQDSPYATPGRRRSSATLDKYFGNEDDTGLLVLDYPDFFTRKQEASTRGITRWTTSGEAAVVVGLELHQDAKDPDDFRVVKLKRKYLETFFDKSKPFDAQHRLSGPVPSSEGRDHFESPSENEAGSVHQWLLEHDEVKPIAGLCSKRTRFVGLHNSLSGGLWATLDRDIFMKDSVLQGLNSNEWNSEARAGSIPFPHAVLEICREGYQSAELIQALDRSHLVERVPGFSLEEHAVWTCCGSGAMPAPLWISLLEKDIRKLPAPVNRRSKRGGSVTGSLSHILPRTSTSVTSATDRQSSPNTLDNMESSATSGPELAPPPLQAFRKKSRRPYSDYPLPIHSEEHVPKQGYWNEYDNPESEDDGYYIYIDPNASVKFPGQEMLENWAHKTKDFFRVAKVPEDPALLSVAEYGSSDEETADEALGPGLRSYGAIASNPRNPRRLHEGCFSSLFRSFQDPYRDAQALDTMRRQSERERQSLLDEIHIRQHEREMTKLRLYCTCLAAAVVINIILGTLTITSRRKERGVVDVAILFGTISNLLLCVFATLSMKTRHERLGWLHQGLVFVVVVGVAIIDILLLRWVYE